MKAPRTMRPIFWTLLGVGLMLLLTGVTIRIPLITAIGSVFLFGIPLYNGLHGMAKQEFYWVWGLYAEKVLHGKKEEMFKGRSAVLFGAIEFFGGLAGLSITLIVLLYS